MPSRSSEHLILAIVHGPDAISKATFEEHLGQLQFLQPNAKAKIGASEQQQQQQQAGGAQEAGSQSTMTLDERLNANAAAGGGAGSRRLSRRASRKG